MILWISKQLFKTEKFKVFLPENTYKIALVLFLRVLLSSRLLLGFYILGQYSDLMLEQRGEKTSMVFLCCSVDRDFSQAAPAPSAKSAPNTETAVLWQLCFQKLPRYMRGASLLASYLEGSGRRISFSRSSLASAEFRTSMGYMRQKKRWGAGGSGAHL